MVIDVRTISIGVGTLIFAGLCSAQAASNILAEDAPAVAARLSPLAAPALERFALETVQEAARSRTPLTITPTAANEAREALRKGLVSTEAAAIIALSQADPHRRRAILFAAAALSQRGRLLQTALLREAATTGDSKAALATLDRLMTAHPPLQQDLLPALSIYLANPGSASALQHMLARRPQWGDAFFHVTARDPRLAGALTRLRLTLPLSLGLKRATEEEVLKSVARAGRISDAAHLYRRLSPEDAERESDSDVDWSTGLRPFGWALSDKPGLQARLGMRASEGLALNIEKGNGGVLAERLLIIPPQASGVVIDHRLAPARLLGDVKVIFTCSEGRAPAIVAAFTAAPIVLALPRAPRCTFGWLRISGRAWSTGPDIHGVVQRVHFTS